MTRTFNGSLFRFSLIPVLIVVFLCTVLLFDTGCAAHAFTVKQKRMAAIVGSLVGAVTGTGILCSLEFVMDWVNRNWIGKGGNNKIIRDAEDDM